jgi:hypothetical protein
LVAAATDIIDDLFMSIICVKMQNNEKSIGPASEWPHRSVNDMEADWRHMRFSRAELRNAAEHYLERPLLRYRELDWLIVNALTYADCLAALDSFRSRIMPFSRCLLKRLPGIRWEASSAQWRLIAFLVKWLLWLVIFILSFTFTYVAPIAWIVVTVLWQWRKWAAQKKFNNLMATMIAAYETMNTSGLNWRRVRDALHKSRDAGAVWDDMIYRLIEDRISVSSDR